MRRKPIMEKQPYQYLAKCLAASMTAYYMGNSVEHEMRVYKNTEPGDVFYALASLLVHGLSRQGVISAELEKALEGHPK
jgi:hypothetical protein